MSISATQREAITPTGRMSPLLQQATGLLVTHGEGAYLYDEAGTAYLDFTTGIGVTSTGHCHPKVVEAIREQAGKLIHGQFTTVLHPNLLELSERLGERLPADLDSLFYANAGTEVVEAAVRLARQATGRTNLLVLQNSFHGRTMASLSLTTSGTGVRAGVQPMMAGVFVTPFPDSYRWGWSEAQATEFALGELDHIFRTQTHPCETAAIFVEPIQGDGGYTPCPPDFLQGLRERCDEHGMLLIADEIQAGFGRSGLFWSHEHADIVPDVVLTAKGLASGMPISAMGARRALMERGWMGSQGGTYGGNAVAAAAAIATIKVIEEEGLVDNARDVGAHMGQRLQQVVDDHDEIDHVRGLGLLMGTVVVDGDGRPDGGRVARLLEAARERGLLLIKCGDQGQIVRWLPPLIVTREQVDQAVDTFVEAVGATR